MVGLDDLQTLVHHRRRVDGDLRAPSTRSGGPGRRRASRSGSAPPTRFGTGRRRRSGGVLRTDPAGPTRSAWWIALCSLSTGRISAPERCAAAVTRSPATTRVSLLARAIGIPASTAARVEAQPDRADQRGDQEVDLGSAGCLRPGPRHPTPPRGRGARGAAPPRRRRRPPRPASAGGGRSGPAAARGSLPAARVATRKRSGNDSTTSSVERPIEPVEPRTASRFTAAGLPPAGRRGRRRRSRAGCRCGRAFRRGRAADRRSP